MYVASLDDSSLAAVLYGGEWVMWGGARLTSALLLTDVGLTAEGPEEKNNKFLQSLHTHTLIF